MKIITFDSKGNEVWTNPPTKKIDKVWEFIEGMFGSKYIKSFLFMSELKFNQQGQIINTVFHENPKVKKIEYIQGELF